MERALREIDVFASGPLTGNPLAVVHDGSGLDTAAMQRFASWTNFSETTFLVPPTEPGADYAVRIFTPGSELPFAGHPTLGSCHAWLEAGGTPSNPETIVQQCGVGLVTLRRTAGGLAFAAPPLIRSGPVDDAARDLVRRVLRLDDADIVDLAWIDNGPGWVGVLLSDAEAVLALEPDPVAAERYDIGVAGLHDDGGPADLEVRAFFREGAAPVEDPVTGSLNASVAQWLLGAGRLRAPFTARQGTAVGRDGRVSVEVDDDGTIWVGGASTTVAVGTVHL